MAAEVDQQAPDRWGVHVHWTDAEEAPRVVPDATVAALHEVIGEPPADLEEWAPVVSRPGCPLGLGSVEVECEDGQVRTVDGALPEDFPLGYHRISTASGRCRSLVV